MSTHALAEELVDFTVAQLTALAGGPLPGLRLPRVLLGHEVGPDVRADLLFTLGLLHACGRAEVAGLDVEEGITGLLAGVDGRRTHTFYSYRVAETVARFGDFSTSRVLGPLSFEQRAAVAEATDSTAWLAALDGGRLPRNYAAVLARCELARRRLGLLAPGDQGLRALLDRVRDVLGGFLDDSNAGVGRYDIYTVDVHLFCEPMAAALGDRWRAGAADAIGLVDRVATRDGAAVPWGRSTGVLAVCHNVELAGLVARHPGVVDPSLSRRVVARAAAAAEALPSWFRDGWVTAHRHRSSDPYRGLDRRLQMTLDCLGKLVDTAAALRAADPLDVDRAIDLFAPRDELVWLDRERKAGVWAFRSAGTAFSLPLVGGTTSDYLPFARNPGLHEAPAGSGLASGVPLLFADGKRYAAGGLPVDVTHDAGVVAARYEGFRRSAGSNPIPPSCPSPARGT